MRFVEVNRATTLHVDLPVRPSAAGTYEVQTVRGGTVQASAAASLSAVSTTLSGAAVAGAASVTVTSATGIVAGRRYLLGGPEETGGEWVTVRSVSGTTVTLARRLIAARASGDAFVSTRVSFALPAIANHGRAHRVVYTWPSADDRPDFVVPFDVCRWSPVSHLSTEDLRTLDPLLAKRLPASVWLPGLIEESWEMLCRHIAQRVEPGGIVGTVDLTTAHGYLARALLAETAGDDTETTAYRARMQERYAQERDSTLASLAYDESQDGQATVQTGWVRTINVMRG